MHTYSMRGCSRERYVFYLALAAITFVAIMRQAAGYIGVAISVTAFGVFAGLFFVFDRWIWKLPKVGSLLGTPDLSGVWKIDGKTDGADGVARDWSGTLIIEQTWSNIAISIETGQSRSRSTMASLERDPGFGYRLIYGYANSRKDVDGELRSHNGTCEAIITEDLQSADAAYFNDHQRRTVGTMKWTRQQPQKVMKK